MTEAIEYEHDVKQGAGTLEGVKGYLDAMSKEGWELIFALPCQITATIAMPGQEEIPGWQLWLRRPKHRLEANAVFEGKEQSE